MEPVLDCEELDCDESVEGGFEEEPEDDVDPAESDVVSPTAGEEDGCVAVAVAGSVDDLAESAERVLAVDVRVVGVGVACRAAVECASETDRVAVPATCPYPPSVAGDRVSSAEDFRCLPVPGSVDVMPSGWSVVGPASRLDRSEAAVVRLAS
ncbi:hypothetical protein ABTY96_36795 [Streptomyces sp. NPDC096057]|uniref:hypothetical protein n=1 Tax=Streptomyces sp. NPDC096057 TaxID=3155543 RepID=UPI00332D68A4